MRVYGEIVNGSQKTLILALAMLLLLSACGGNYPADPYGTLQRATGGSLRVGVAQNEPFTSVVGSRPSGLEVDLIREYAERIGAEVQWETDGEDDLMEELSHGELDVVIGGITEHTPWKTEVGLTNPYATTTNAGGEQEKHVLAIRKGENAFLMDLERFLEGKELPI
ncbi:hypothetical protein ASH00_04610 [Arthrobacter sp. Soil782]|uniref:substrate-binding periplasmic protein n=1 Tax=Arthrobacter sp. Soil782 TaxID=1736410 RepID=UPI0007000C1F|nr:transporter substrate-binding domain-containing protein [Arthrobacter sp. Soil782]KRF09502.1 hypothetical protein ASH00_04610 [Arthrobacter sp. Soil782]